MSFVPSPTKSLPLTLRQTLDKVTEQLGEAARKPSPPAYATATASSEGRNEATAPPASGSPMCTSIRFG